MTTQQPNQAQLYATILELLHKNFTAHKGQILIGKAIFNSDKLRVFLQCGRQFGKTSIAAYIAVRWACLNPNSRIYYFAPLRDQVRKTFWDKLIQMVPKEVLTGDPHHTSLTLHFFNGSQIICDGSDNTEKNRGISPNLLIVDEFKDFRPEFWPAMEPALSVSKGRVLFMGTPPKLGDDNRLQYIEVSKDCEADADYEWYKMPSWINPHMDRKFLKKVKASLTEKGELDVWLREYEAEIVMGGDGAIFPMFRESKHIIPYQDMLDKYIVRDVTQLQWYLVTDPASSSCFAAIVVAYNPYNGMVYVLDEIYERNPNETSTGKMWPKMKELMKEATKGFIEGESDIWYRVYDEAARWFANEMSSQYGIGFVPTEKAQNDKQNGLSLIKDQLLKGKLIFSDRCTYAKWEIQNYVRDKNGNIPKKDDHIIDTLRYLNAAMCYDFHKEVMQVANPDIRAYTIEDDIKNDNLGLDDGSWMGDF